MTKQKWLFLLFLTLSSLFSLAVSKVVFITQSSIEVDLVGLCVSSLLLVLASREDFLFSKRFAVLFILFSTSLLFLVRYFLSYSLYQQKFSEVALPLNYDGILSNNLFAAIAFTIILSIMILPCYQLLSSRRDNIEH